MSTVNHREALGVAIEDRIRDLGLEYMQVAQRARVSVETLGKARRGAFVGPKSLSKIALAIGWTATSPEQVLQGGLPTLAPPGPVMAPSSKEGLPIEQTQPSVILSEGTPPLAAGERLRGWDRGDGQRHYRLDVDGGEGGYISTIYPASTPVEEVARRLRAAIAVTQV